MTRLADKIILSNSIWESLDNPNSSRDSFLNAHHLIADNVAQYYFLKSPKSQWTSSDFPNVAPPFENFFIEFRMPSSINSEGKIIRTPSDWIGVEAGIAFYARNVERDDDYTSVLEEIHRFENPSGISMRWKGGIRKWVLNGSLFFGKQSRIIMPCQLYMLIDTVGRIIPLEDSTPFVFLANSLYSFSDVEHILDSAQHTILYPILLSLSFLHCKNVTMQRETPPVPLSKKYEKKYGRPLISYHTLNIEPMKTILRTEGNIEKTGLKQALHICRGHFKDYSKGGGLFGKYKGLYWWDSTVRGSVTEGIVDKDYAVKSPKG